MLETFETPSKGDVAQGSLLGREALPPWRWLGNVEAAEVLVYAKWD